MLLHGVEHLLATLHPTIGWNSKVLSVTPYPHSTTDIHLNGRDSCSHHRSSVWRPSPVSTPSIAMRRPSCSTPPYEIPLRPLRSGGGRIQMMLARMFVGPWPRCLEPPGRQPWN